MTERPFTVRKGALNVETFDKKQIVSAPWVTTVSYPDFAAMQQGVEPQVVPLELPVEPGQGVLYDEAHQVVHVRDVQRGEARTYTPTVCVQVDYTNDFFEMEFRDPEDPATKLPAVQLVNGNLGFEDRKAFGFSNMVMFQVFCDHMNSPIFNPFSNAIEVEFVLEPEDEDDDEDDISFLVFDIARKAIRTTDGSSVDQIRSPIVSFMAELGREIPAWDKDTREDGRFGPGTYSVEVLNADWQTGDIKHMRFLGHDTGGKYRDMFVDWEVFKQELDLQHARIGNVVERQHFDVPRYSPPVATTSKLRKPSKPNFLDKIFGRT